MSQFKVWQVVVLELPKRSTKKDEDEGFSQAPKIVLEPVTVVARDDKDAAIKVAMKHADKFKGVDQERLEVAVRPF